MFYNVYMTAQCKYCGKEIERVTRPENAECFDCKTKRKKAYAAAHPPKHRKSRHYSRSGVYYLPTKTAP